MTSLGHATLADLKDMQSVIIAKIANVRSFEDAAQIYTSLIYERFRNSIALLRHFITVPFHALPGENQKFVSALAALKVSNSPLAPQTLVLSLVGTSGVEAAWNDRRHSKGHVGIPLISSAFVETIPMMSRLLKELGVGLDWIDSHDTQIAEKTMGLMNGLFFVADASREVDAKGRKIIAAQDFVAKYGVQSVFGFGGGYLGTKAISVTIIFLRERLEKRQAEFFASTMTRLRTQTVELVKTRIFNM